MKLTRETCTYLNCASIALFVSEQVSILARRKRESRRSSSYRCCNDGCLFCKNTACGKAVDTTLALAKPDPPAF